MSVFAQAPTSGSSSTTERNSTVPVLHRAQALWHSLPATLHRLAQSGWQQLQRSQALPVLRKRHRRLRVSETLSLGEKRSVCILEVDGQSFLVGSTGTNVTLLASLAPQTPFADMLQHTLQRDGAS